jgi:hypothetical protein
MVTSIWQVNTAAWCRFEVAVKQILEEHANDPFSRERFVAEAEITDQAMMSLTTEPWTSVKRKSLPAYR